MLIVSCCHLWWAVQAIVRFWGGVPFSPRVRLAWEHFSQLYYIYFYLSYFVFVFEI